MRTQVRNIGILSHVDAGKTTISEHFLFLGGAISSPGDVNKGTTVTDSLPIEKERGVSVCAANVSFSWKGHQINLVDTPGHTDFSAEVERSLQILDGAILVISAVEGLQSHTFALWEALKTRGIPVLIFINKTDRQGADFQRVLHELNSSLHALTFPLNFPENEGTIQAKTLNVLQSLFSDEARFYHNLALENLAGLDEEILEAYLEGMEISPTLINEKLRFWTLSKKIHPVLTGVAKTGEGIPELLDAVVAFLPVANASSGKLSALVFKIEHDKTLGRLAHFRVFDGQLKVKEKIWNITTRKEEKIAQLKKSENGKIKDCSELLTGDIGIASGLPEVNSGDILGSDHKIPPNATVQVPTMTVQVKPVRNAEFFNLANALLMLNSEDPKLNFRWYKDEHELHINLMGKIQMEIMESILLHRFELEVVFGEPSVIYKETPSNRGIGFASYTMPKPCWAVTKFLIEPGKRNSGITYASEVSVDKVKQKYQNEISNIINKALEQGIKGWEVTDIKITLIDGEDHEMHSRPGDFIIATPMALMQGLKLTGTNLLEPVFNFVIKAPEELLGKIAGDLHKMRGTFGTPVFGDGIFELKGKMPAATLADYGIKLGSMSGGKGQIRLTFAGYEPCPENEGVVRPYKGVNPLDQSQWILHARGAFKSEERRM